MMLYQTRRIALFFAALLCLLQGTSAQGNGAIPDAIRAFLTTQGECFRNGPPREQLVERDAMGNIENGGIVTLLACACLGGDEFLYSSFGVDYKRIITRATIATPNGPVFVTKIGPRLPAVNRNRLLQVTAEAIQIPNEPEEFEVESLCTVEGSGEPHIKKWDGTWFDWHGECDNVLLHAEDAANGLGIDIHTRNKIRYNYAYIETVAIRVGTDILEVSSFGEYLLNGISQAEMPNQLGGYIVTHTKRSDKGESFFIDFEGIIAIAVHTFKDLVSVKINHDGSSMAVEWFQNSSGLMGHFGTGTMYARDGLTVLEDPVEFGMEWQVLDSDPKLFQLVDRAPQFPDKCRLPAPMTSDEKRRLFGNDITQESAELACAHWKDEGERAGCVYDVLAIQDLELALAGAY